MAMELLAVSNNGNAVLRERLSNSVSDLKLSFDSPLHIWSCLRQRTQHSWRQSVGHSPLGDGLWDTALLETVCGTQPSWRQSVRHSPLGDSLWDTALLETVCETQPSWRQSVGHSPLGDNL
jgi:hypothetical protein